MAVPMRRCRVCRTSRPKGELQRWVKKGADLVPDPHQNLPGRGFYTCSDSCAEILSDKIRKTGK